MKLKSLESVRNQIDKVDKELVALLVKRTNLALEALKYKSNTDEVKGCDRVKIVLDKVENLAREEGGNETVISNIYKSIIKELTDLQLNIFNKEK